MKKVALVAGVCVLTALVGRAQIIWINEFHYDNAGADSGEFVELAVPSSFTSLSTVTLTLYNGGNGASYGTNTLDTFTPGGTSGGYTYYSKSIPGIQNGAPDGFSLDVSGTVLQFLSYEGVFAAANGPAVGMTSVDIGVAESDPGTATGSALGLTGTGSTYADFAWTTFTANTAGQINASQTLVPVPEPHEYALGAGLRLLGFALVAARF